MLADTILEGLIRANLIGGAGIVLVMLLRPPVRRFAGSRAAYALWLVPPVAAFAALLPTPWTDEITQAAAAPATSATATTVQSVLASPAGPAFDWRLVVLALWLAGAAIATVAVTLRHRAAVRGLGRMTRESAGVMRAESSDLGPAVVGVLSPRIVLPADFEARFDEQERKVVMAHERVHLAHRHVPVKAAAQALACLNWFNPLVHLATASLTIDQELACDEMVIGAHPTSKKAYAKALLKTQGALALPLGCYWPSQSSRTLKDRIGMLTRDDPGRTRRWSAAAGLGALALAASVAAWAAQPARTVMVSAPTPVRTAVNAAPTPRVEAPASGVTAARELRPDAVPSSSQGETSMTNQRTRLAGAAVVAALSLGTGSAMAAPEPQVGLTNSGAAAPAPTPVPGVVGLQFTPRTEAAAGSAAQPASGETRTMVTFNGRRPAAPPDPVKQAAINAALGLPANALPGINCRLGGVVSTSGGRQTTSEQCFYTVEGAVTPISAETAASLRAQGLLPTLPPAGSANFVTRRPSE